MSEVQNHRLLPACLFGAALMLLCTAGTAGCLITGYSLPVNSIVLTVGCLSDVLLISLLFSHPRKKIRWFSLVCIVLFALFWFQLRKGFIIDGIRYTEALVFGVLRSGYRNLSMPAHLMEYNIFGTSTLPAQLSETINTFITEAVLFWILLLALLFGCCYFLLEIRNQTNRFIRLFAMILSALIPVPSFVLCFLIIGATIPDTWALCMILVFWLLILFTSGAVQLQPNAAALQAVCLLFPSLLLLYGVYCFYPKQAAVSTVLQSAYDSVVTLLTSAGSTVENSASDWIDNLLIGTPLIDSAEGSTIRFSMLGSRHYSGRTVMEIQSDHAGFLYLRENTYNLYTESGWSYADLPDVMGEKAVSVLWEDGSASVKTLSLEDGFETAILHSSSVILKENGMPFSTVTLSKVHAPLIFSPYFFYKSSAETAFASDRSIQNVSRDNAYSIVYYPFSGQFSALKAKTNAVLEQRAVLSLYEEITNELYTAIDAPQKEALQKLLLENGIRWQNTEMWELIPRVTEYVKNTAEYSLDAAFPPSDKDFVLWFLEDAEVGYCVHYATAAVMLFRACGIPARLASGYLAHIPSENEETPILDSNAHAWTEVFDVRLGWIPVEATPSGGLSNESSGSGNGNGNSGSKNTTDSDFGESAVPETTEAVRPIETSSAIETEPLQTTEIGDSSSDTTTHPVDFTGIDRDSDDSDTIHSVHTDSAISGSDPADKNPAKQAFPIDTAKLYTVIVSILCIGIVLAILLLIAIRYRHVRLAGLNRILEGSYEDSNQAALDLCNRCHAVARALKLPTPPDVEALAEKARFSHHRISQNELIAVFDRYSDLVRRLKQKDKPVSFARFRHFWIDVFW